MPESKVGVKLEIDAKQALSASEAYLAALKRIENATNRFAAQSARTSLSLGKGLNQAIGAINQQTSILVGELRALQPAMSSVATAQDRVTKSVHRGSASWVKHTKKMALWAVGAASAYRMYMKIRRALGESFEALYGNTEEYKRLTAAVSEFKIAIALAVMPVDDAKDSMNSLASAIESTNSVLLAHAANMVVWGKELEQVIDVTVGRVASQKVEDFFVTIGTKMPIAAQAMSTIYHLVTGQTPEWEAALERQKKALEDATDATKNYERAIKSLVSIAQRWAEAQEEFTERQRKAGVDHWARMADIRDDYFQKIRDADEKYQDAITGANAKAAKAREKAWKKYYIRIKQIQKRAQRDVQKLIDQHNLRQKHAKQSYDLSMLQSERLYQYQRGMLVAEGDVLAIEDLDARYELEKQAREENYELQRQQAEAMFQLQLKYQKEANRDLIVALRASLQEQLAEIEAARQERVAEAEDEHAEDKADADKWREEEMADEDERHAKQLKANAEYLEDMKEQTAERLADIAKEYGLSADEINGIWAKVMGYDGELAVLTEQAVSRQETYAAQFREAWVSAIDAATEALSRWSGAMTSAGGGGGGYGGRSGRSGGSRQYGGDDIISTPTWIMVGEAGPERVSVQPLSPIGGALSLGWSGGPIPVHGSGEFSNADLSGIGDAIAQGIVLTMRDQVLSYRGQRGY